MRTHQLHDGAWIDLDHILEVRPIWDGYAILYMFRDKPVFHEFLRTTTEEEGKEIFDALLSAWRGETK